MQCQSSLRKSTMQNQQSVYQIQILHLVNGLLINATLILSSYIHAFTYFSGSYSYNPIKMCKQISTPPQPYQKIPDI